MNLLEVFYAAQHRGLLARGVKSRTAQVRGTTVHYYLAQGTAAGPPLVLLHGLGATAQNFVFCLKPLARHFSRVYAIDLPGCGYSPVPASGPLELLGHFEVLRRFIAEVVGERCVLVGNSLGGALSLFQAIAHPGSLLGTVLLAPAGAPAPPAELHAVLDAFNVRTDAGAKAFLHRVLAKPQPIMLAFPSVTRAMLSTPAVRHLANTLSHEELLKEGELQALQVPLLLLWGGREKLLPANGPDFFRAQLPAKYGKVEVVPHWSHLPQLEFPREVVERVTKFAATFLPGHT